MTGLFHIPTPTNEPIFNYAPGSVEKKSLKSELASQSATQMDIPLVIGEESVYKKQTTAVCCPHKKSRVLAHCADADENDMAKAIEAVRKVQPEWAALPWEERASVFLRAADLLATEYRNKINAATMLGQSKTVFQSEIDAVCELADFLRFNAWFAEQIYREQPPISPRGQWNRLSARGLEGFVFAVGPFNFTSISVNLACAPALMGCGVIWKPAHTAALSSYYTLEILKKAGLPPGVINFVPGPAQPIGAYALKSADLAGVHFTGSTATFRKLWKGVAENLENYRSYPRLVGETGGKDFVFAHASCDVQALATALVRGAFEYQGQKCSAASRAYIPKSIWPDLKQRLIAQTEELKVGSPEDFTNFMAAVIDEPAYKKIISYIEYAKNSTDATIIAGGDYDNREGFFIRPTIVVTENPHHKLMCEEIFGPVLTLYVYEEDQLEETIQLVDQSTPYALTGAIFASDRRVVHKLSKQLENAAGNFYINDKPTGAVVGQQPFGGGRASGTNDKAGSVYNLLRWVSHRTIKENFLHIGDYRYPHMQES